MPALREHQTPEPLRVALAGLFTTRCQGRANALTLAQLCARVDIGRYPERQVREAIAELVTIDGLPIAGDSGAGYYLAVTAEERLAQCRELARRIRAMGRRLRIFAGRAAERTGGQMSMDYSLTPEEIATGEAWARRVCEAIEEDEDE